MSSSNDNELADAQFYLHENGSVIYKPRGGVDASSTLVRAVWQLTDVAETPERFYQWLQELRELGANEDRLQDLWAGNNLTLYLGKKKRDEFFA